ncbi:thyrotropin-releasing hormone receptor-like [Haliotis cracherodii]|uniref:thyrotropin-releasing hormone receptor-like n=1 Tax=Haliotis cracherodii TaxID=6455 RepID=UPI0039EC1BD7
MFYPMDNNSSFFNMTTATESSSKINEASPSNDLDATKYILDLEAEKRAILQPAIFFTGLVGPISFFGNITILIVYSRQFKESATRSFILTVALFDLLSTSIALPAEIFSLLNNASFPSPILCKCYVFVEQFCATASSGALVVFAGHRFRKICTPLKNQMTVTTARSFRLCVCTLALGLTWPAFVLYGDQTTTTPFDDVLVRTCGVQDYFKDSVFTVIYRCVFMAMFTLGAVPIAVLYILIARKLLLLRRCQCKAALPYQKVMREMIATVKLRSISESSNTSWRRAKISASTLRYSTKQSNMFTVPKRTTLMIATTTVVIYLSFLPNLILRLLEHFNTDFLVNQSFPALSVYHLFLRFYYLHCAANPIIYSTFSVKFRQEFQNCMCGITQRCTGTGSPTRRPSKGRFDDQEMHRLSVFQ